MPATDQGADAPNDGEAKQATDDPEGVMPHFVVYDAHTGELVYGPWFNYGLMMPFETAARYEVRVWYWSSEGGD